MCISVFLRSIYGIRGGHNTSQIFFSLQNFFLGIQKTIWGPQSIGT